MQLTPNALEILKGRYLKEKETPEMRFEKVAETVAKAEKEPAKWDYKFFSMMERLDFLPNTPCIANAGRGSGQLNACFVLPVEDTLTNRQDTGIMDTARNAALIHQTGGGTGFDFSRLRRAGARVSSSNGTASGPVPFMRMYNAITDCIKQGGIRRGANMGILRVDHPDVRDFITLKTDQHELNNFNVSVAVTNEFMEKVRSGDREARELWILICNSAWKYGDPGIFFVDRANEDNPLLPEYPIRATNPCGEIPMPDNDACNLGSINLGNFVVDGVFEEPRFRDTVRLAIRFLDNVVTVNKVPIKAIEKFTKQTRRLGLGIMGWADFLNKMEIPYDDNAALIWVDTIGNALKTEARRTSKALAEEKGPYPLAKATWLRNVALLSIAPTGSISLIAGCSSGIEPYFRRSVTHTGALGTIRIDYPNAEKPWFRTASEVDPSWHVMHQAAWQKYMDNGVSKTVNMDNAATPDDVRATYELAWSMRCKGITIFRDGSRDKQVYDEAKCIDGACEIAETPGIRHTHATIPPGKPRGAPDSGRPELVAA